MNPVSSSTFSDLITVEKKSGKTRKNKFLTLNLTWKTVEGRRMYLVQISITQGDRHEQETLPVDTAVGTLTEVQTWYR